MNFDSEIANRILSHIRAGNTRATAAHLCKVRPAVVTAWVTRGQCEDDPELTPFSDAVLQAEADAEAAMVRALFDAAQDGQWRAALAWLERARRDTWTPDAVPVSEQPRVSPVASMSLPEQRAYILRCLAHVNGKLGIVE